MDDPEKFETVKSSNIVLWISLAILAGLIASYFVFYDFKAGVDEAFDVLTSKDRPRIKAWVDRFGLFGPIVLILAMTLQMFLLIIPNLLLFIISIMCYGPIWG